MNATAQVVFWGIYLYP